MNFTQLRQNLAAELDSVVHDGGSGRSVRLIFSATAWSQYLSRTDRELVERINDLIADIIRNGYEGIGKPEPLRGELSGLWSRRIDREHRLVYRIKDGDVEVVACEYHHGSR